MRALAQALFTVQEQTEKCGFQEEGEATFHRQSLSNDATRKAGKMRPVGAKLKLHRDSGHNPDCEINTEDLGPKTGGFVVGLVVRPHREGLKNHDQRREPHSQLREQIVVCHGESELQTMDQECAIPVSYTHLTLP